MSLSGEVEEVEAVKLRGYLSIAVVVVSLLSLSAPCHAVWLFYSDQRLVAGPQIKDSAWVASSFQVAADGYANTFGAAVMKMIGPAGSGISMSLVETVFGVPDLSRTLGTWTITPISATPGYIDVYLPDPSTWILMKASRTYSIVLRPNDPGFVGGATWMQYAGHSGWGSSNQGQTWSGMLYPMLVRVGGELVPEPASFTMLASGLALGLMVLRKRR